MRANEFVFELIIDESRKVDLKPFDIAGHPFLLHPHASAQTLDRDVTSNSVRMVMAQVPKVLNQIKQFQPGQAFYVTDPRINVSLGFRVLASGKIMFVTVVPSTKPYARGDAPVLMVNKLDKGYHESK